MLNYTAKYTKVDDGYMGQIIEWPEVISEGEDIEACRFMLRDALQEMILAYRQQQRELPSAGGRANSPRGQPCRSNVVTLFNTSNKMAFRLLREGANHAIYTDGEKTIPIKRHRTLDRITANALCKQAGLQPKF